MFSKINFILAFVCCTLAVATAAVIYDDSAYLQVIDPSFELKPLDRHVRSPDGSVRVDVNKDAGGRTAGVEYNQNLYKGDNGRFKVDAYGRAERDFDRHRNDYGGGIRGSWRF